MGFIILGIVLLLLAALCLLPIYVRLYSDGSSQPRFAVKVLWLTFPGEKAKKEKKKQPKPSASGKKDTAVSKYTGAGSLKKSIAEKGLFQTVEDIFRLVRPILQRIFKLVKKIRICRLHLQIGCTGEDAAITYGKVCAIAYPMCGYVQSLGAVKRNAVDVNIYCDYQQEAAEFSYDLICSIRVGSILLAGLGILTGLIGRRFANEKNN